MKRITYTNTLPYEKTTHAGAPYRIGTAYRNHGQLCESIVKWRLGLYTEVNPNTSFDEGSDIEELRASVKSHKCSLAKGLRGETMDEKVNDFITRGHSTTWVWVEWNEKTELVDEYWMDETEFRAFCKRFLTNDPRGANKINPRFMNTTYRKPWLDSRAVVALG